MMLLVRALSRIPYTRIQVSSMQINNAGRLNQLPVNCPPMIIGSDKLLRQMDAENALENVVEVRGEADRHRHVRHRVLQDQVPPDHPRQQFAHRRVGVRVCAARYRNGACHLGVAQRGKAHAIAVRTGTTARSRPCSRPPDRETESGPSASGPTPVRAGSLEKSERLAGRRRPGQDENPRADDCTDAQSHQAPRPERLLPVSCLAPPRRR